MPRILALVLLTAVLGFAIADDAKRPNIILIITDDQGYGDASCNGNPILKTPNIDRLAKEGVRFEDFHVSPTCAPTRCSIFTGRHEFRSGVSHTIMERERMSLKATPFTPLLREAGYTTGIFGKWHLGDEAAYRPDQRGFDEVFIHGTGGIGQTFAGVSSGDAPKNSYFNPVILHNNKFTTTEGYCTDVFFRQAEKWIDTVKGTKPFFCYISTNAPHAPLDVPPEWEAKYAEQGLKKDVVKFFGMIANIDWNLGRLLDKLREDGLERDTLVIFMNDNGGTAGTSVFNAGMRGQKVTERNGGTRGMSIWRRPGTYPPAQCYALTSAVDYFPTFVELAGAKTPPEVAAKLEGFSLVPLLKNPDAKWHDDRTLVTHVGRWKKGSPPDKDGPSSVRWKDYLLVRGKNGGLFDLKRDPGETKDLAGDKPEVAAKLSAYFDAWWAETLGQLDNEDAWKTAPKWNPFHELYWKQFAGPGPNHAPPPPDFMP